MVKQGLLDSQIEGGLKRRAVFFANELLTGNVFRPKTVHRIHNGGHGKKIGTVSDLTTYRRFENYPENV